jgi:hypothetical protein
MEAPMDALQQVVDRYVALWNEPDAERRRAGIAEVWAPDAAHFTPSMEAHGHAGLETRIAGAYDRFVATGQYVFRHCGNIAGHHDTVKFNWQMVPSGGGPVAALGFDFLVLDGEGRILRDYQYIEPTPA